MVVMVGLSASGCAEEDTNDAVDAAEGAEVGTGAPGDGHVADAEWAPDTADAEDAPLPPGVEPDVEANNAEEVLDESDTVDTAHDLGDTTDPPAVVKGLDQVGYETIRLTEVLVHGGVAACAGSGAGFMEVRWIGTDSIDLTGLELWSSNGESAFVDEPVLLAPGERAVFAFDPAGFETCYGKPPDGLGPPAPSFDDGDVGVYHDGRVDDWVDWGEDDETPAPQAGASYSRDDSAGLWCFETAAAVSGDKVSPRAAGSPCGSPPMADGPAFEAAIGPKEPTTADDLVVSLAGVPSGATLAYSWTRNGVPTAFDGWRIPREATRLGEAWAVTVVATVSGTPFQAAASVTLEKAVPTVYVEALYALKDGCHVAVCLPRVVDDGGADVAVEVSYAWGVDGKPVPGSSETLPIVVSESGNLTCSATVTTPDGSSTATRQLAVKANSNTQDGDGDGVCDAGDLCPGSDDALGDHDDDGLCAEEEIALGTSDESADTDSDGLQDADELALGTDPATFDGSVLRATLFVSSADAAPNLGFPGGLDAWCQSLATVAGVQGTFLVFAADNEVSAKDRAIDRPWFRTDGRLIATSLADLLDDQIRLPVNVDETGATRDSVVYTGLKASGESALNRSCESWTGVGQSAIGHSWETDHRWVDQSEDFGCSSPAAYYCMGWE